MLLTFSLGQDYSLQFDGTSEVKIIGGEFISGNEPRSISVWANKYPSNYASNIISLGSGLTYNARFSIYVQSNGLLRVAGESNDWLTGYYLPDNELTHLVVTSDGASVKLYVNSILTAEDSYYYNTDSSQPIMIGTNTDDRNDEYFLGEIDNLIITNDILSEEEIWILAFGLTDGIELDNSIGFYKFNEGEGTTLYDHSGNENHGIINGATWVCNDIDECGVCGGDDSSCSGCTDTNATNYDEAANVDDGSCEYCNLGEINGDGSYNVMDVVQLANCVLAENCNLLENVCAADINGDGNYNVMDIVILANCILAENCNS